MLMLMLFRAPLPGLSLTQRLTLTPASMLLVSSMLQRCNSFVLRLLSRQPVQALVRSSPELAAQPKFQALSNLRGVDVVAVRLFFKERLNMPRAASVAGGGMAPGKKHGTGRDWECCARTNACVARR